MSVGFFIGVVLTLCLIVGAGVWSGKQLKSAAEYTSAGSAKLISCTGALMGTMIGGSATVGTAEMAYLHGFSAMWFMGGAAIAFILMNVFLLKPMRRSGEPTVGGVIGKEYGPKARTFVSLCSDFGCAVVLLCQLSAGTAVASIILPGVPAVVLTVGVCLLILSYIFFGGMKSAGIVGTVKTCLLLPTVYICGILAVRSAGGVSALYAALDHKEYFNLFARGVGADISAGAAVILGSFATPGYLIPLMDARDTKTAARTLSIATVVAPLIAISGTMVGLYMRYIAPPEVLADPVLLAAAAKSAFPSFILSKIPPLFAGVMLVALIIAVVGTSASQCISVSMSLQRDILGRTKGKIAEKLQDPVYAMRFSRTVILSLMAVITLLSLSNTSLVFELVYLSMVFLAAPVLPGYFRALFRPGTGSARAIIAGGTAGILVTIIAKTAHWPVDGSFAGIVGAFIVAAVVQKLSPRRSL